MTKRAFILLAVLLIVAAFYCFPASRPPRPPGTIEFLGITNNPALGKCALLRITMGTWRELGWFNVSMETKTGDHWLSSFSPWQLAGGPGSSANITMHGQRSIVVLVAQPALKAAYRVRFDCGLGPSPPIALLRRVTYGGSDHFIPPIGDRMSLVTEIHD